MLMEENHLESFNLVNKKRKKMKIENKNQSKRNQETDFHSVEINTAHFDTVKYKCFIMEKLKRSWKVTYF